MHANANMARCWLCSVGLCVGRTRLCSARCSNGAAQILAHVHLRPTHKPTEQSQRRAMLAFACIIYAMFHIASRRRLRDLHKLESDITRAAKLFSENTKSKHNFSGACASLTARFDHAEFSTISISPKPLKQKVDFTSPRTVYGSPHTAYPPIVSVVVGRTRP